MEKKKFAFESEKVSVAFPLINALGDTVISKKFFDAIIELAPDCLIDIFCLTENHAHMAVAFFGQSKNLNLILKYTGFYQESLNHYDLVLRLCGSCFFVLDGINAQNLQRKSPALFESVIKINEYNKRNLYGIGSGNAISLRNICASKILGKNCYWFLSCAGAFPIRDDKVNIPLHPAFKPVFDKLKLDKYITVYTDIAEHERERPKNKTWPIKYFVEYVSRMKKKFPAVEIIQCGGGGDIKIENADRHYLAVDLELTKYILANSLLHVGCEGGLVHLATALGTKCLVLFGFTSVHYYGYARNINVVSDVCYPCADIWKNSMSRFCVLSQKNPPCMLSHTPQLVCDITCNYLKNNA